MGPRLNHPNCSGTISRGSADLDIFYLVLKHLVLIFHSQNIRAFECSCEELEPLHYNDPFLDPQKNDHFSGVPEIPDIFIRLQPFEAGLVSFERAINKLSADASWVLYQYSLLGHLGQNIEICLLLRGKK